MRRVTDADYARLLEFRTALRRFLSWSETQAKSVGLTPAQHQLLLAIKGHPHGDPSVREIAEYLLLRHNSAVELIDRAVRAGLVQRYADAADGRSVRARLTTVAEAKLNKLTALTLEEVGRLGPVLTALNRDGTS